MLKGEPSVITFLKKTNTYRHAHFWKEDELELKDISFLLSYVPTTHHSQLYVKNGLFEKTKLLPDVDWAGPTIPIDSSSAKGQTPY
jgi:hypothetical protein